jgi:uncharacterized protein YndB with AHSA1/START domain
MEPVTVTVNIARPREEVFAYLEDFANHAEFTDHYLKDWHLTRMDSVGLGAGARYRVDAPLNRFPWADATFIEIEAPFRIVEAGRAGKFNRIRVLGEWVLTPTAGGQNTRVEFTNETIPGTPTDRILESFGARGWIKRKNRKALKRLRAILEEDDQRGQRVTVADR